MKKIFAAALLSLSAPAWSLCSYPLDATRNEIKQLPLDIGSLGTTNVVNGQTMDYTVVETPTPLVFAALSDTGVQALLTAYQTGLPQGDLTLPASGTIHVRMRLEEFPWNQFIGAESNLDHALYITTGNHFGSPTDSLEIVVRFGNSNLPDAWGGRTVLQVSGQAFSGGVFRNYNSITPLTLPLEADVVGVWINMDTREVGLSAHVLDGNSAGVPAGDYDLPPFDNNFHVPAGVSAVTLGMQGFLNHIEPGEPQIGAHVRATLETDYCGSTGPAPLTLPGGKLFPGQGKAKGLQKFQGLPFGTAPLGQLLKAAKQ